MPLRQALYWLIYFPRLFFWFLYAQWWLYAKHISIRAHIKHAQTYMYIQAHRYMCAHTWTHEHTWIHMDTHEHIHMNTWMHKRFSLTGLLSASGNPSPTAPLLWIKCQLVMVSIEHYPPRKVSYIRILSVPKMQLIEILAKLESYRTIWNGGCVWGGEVFIWSVW